MSHSAAYSFHAFEDALPDNTLPPAPSAGRDAPQCAHLRVVYRTEQVEHDFGPRRASTDPNDPNVPSHGVQRVTRGWWECDYGCGTRFVPNLPSVAAPLSEREGREPRDAEFVRCEYCGYHYHHRDIAGHRIADHNEPAPLSGGSPRGGDLSDETLRRLRFLPRTTLVPDDATIAERILASVADMRRSGAFADGTALCWSPAELELLAMYAIDAKNKLAANLRD